MSAPVLSVQSQDLITKAQNHLSRLFQEVRMPESHGVNHCLVVLGHMESAIQAGVLSNPVSLNETKKLTLCLAALLHEADDHKYFGPESSNTETILKKVCDGGAESAVISEVLQMISYVSASVNGNTVPAPATKDPTLLWPRFCDRLEAIGTSGAVRCLQYNQEEGAPLYTQTTPRPVTEEELWTHVTQERWNKYQNGGNSASMMDHYYDKLLQIAVFEPAVVQNSYLVTEATKRVEPLVRICLEFGKSGEAPIDLINSFKK
jgi:hypothetical protein